MQQPHRAHGEKRKRGNETVDKREAVQEGLYCVLTEPHTFSQPSGQREGGLSAAVTPVPLPCLVTKVNIRGQSIRKRVYQLTVAAVTLFNKTTPNLSNNHAFSLMCPWVS